MLSDAFSRNQTLIGWLTGILAPPLAGIAGSMLYFKGMSLPEIYHLYATGHVLPHVISLSAIINLLFFFGFIKYDKDLAARGVLGATFMYVFIVIWLKFL